ncbi:DUF2075 domain-containing protein [soil metagenome]
MPAIPPDSAYYSSEIDSFRTTSPAAILGQLVQASQFAVEGEQRDAWLAQIDILKQALEGIPGKLLLEFKVPRIGSRLDAVVVTDAVVIAIEFKVGAGRFNVADINQVWDYALDLKNFHKGSRDVRIIPVLVATDALASDRHVSEPFADLVHTPLRCNSAELGWLIKRSSQQSVGQPIDADAWARSPYSPTPTIIEAARALYASHSVEALGTSEAGENLTLTTRALDDLIEQARSNGTKNIVFITGVPGAGKTLVGLNIATTRYDAQSETHAVFLSGNGPLVAVLTEALTRDEVGRMRRAGQKCRKGDVRQSVKSFIQNIHHFRDEGLRDLDAPSDRIVIFDEAQRAWDRDMTSDFMRRKKGRPGFDQSEPQFLIGYMDRHQDWAVVVCLVGGGQEINRGEAGISSWLDAVREHFPGWTVHISPSLVDSEYAAGTAISRLEGHTKLVENRALHLSVSMRSFRAENVSQFVKAALDCDRDLAQVAFAEMDGRYPIAVTRCLDLAKSWIRGRARGTERFGLVATSGALRLKPHAIDVRAPIDPIHWFLSDATDVRSSFYLEDAATEFQVQGLELDWACVNWDADLRYAGSGWNFHSFVGSKWSVVRKADRMRFLKNAYRVLLTRARQGMVIFVPPGDARDPTRPPEFYDPTFAFLKSLGLPVLE